MTKQALDVEGFAGPVVVFDAEECARILSGLRSETGKPETWRRFTQVPRPASTILFAENTSGADHIMPHFWLSASDASDVAKERHGRRANYNFADGHAQALEFRATYAPSNDLWNPSLAK